jgi:hypothetical protein
VQVGIFTSTGKTEKEEDTMSAPSKAYTFQLVKIQSEERLATTSELNLAPSLVTSCREARGMGYWATTQVKGLSSEIIIVSVADSVHGVGRQYSHNRYRRGYENPTESKTVARYQRDGIGTRETQCIPVKVCDDKPENGKESQKMHWESDQFIVVMKPCNGGGAKGLAGKSLERGHIVQTQSWDNDVNKTLSIIPNMSEEVFLKSRVQEICKHGSVRGFMVDSERRWL